MKRYHIGLAITLSLLVVVGGVYATWKYATNGIAEKSADFTVELTAKENVDRGTLEVTGTVGILLDDAVDNDHKAELALTSESTDVTVTFTPTDGNMTLAELQTLDLQYQLQILNSGDTVVDAVTYGADSDTVTVMEFASDEAKGVHVLDDCFNTASSRTDAVTVTISKDTILGYLKTALELPTPEDYEACKTGIEGYKLRLTVQEKVAP